MTKLAGLSARSTIKTSLTGYGAVVVALGTELAALEATLVVFFHATKAECTQSRWVALALTVDANLKSTMGQLSMKFKLRSVGRSSHASNLFLGSNNGIRFSRSPLLNRCITG